MKQQTVNDLFKQSKQDWLEDARAAARKLLSVRYSITIEDVLELAPLPKYLHCNTKGSVFNHPDFKAIGWQRSRRTAMHGRQVRVWTETLESDREKEVEVEQEIPRNWRQISPLRRFFEAE